MTLLKILSVTLGAAFMAFGYLIFFRKKYTLINGFEDDLKAGRKDTDYARRVGLVDFTVGTGILIAGVALILFA